ILIRAPFSTTDLEVWKTVVKNYRSDPISVTKHFEFLIKQHNPDWSDIQLLLDCSTDTEKNLIIKAANDLAEDYHKTMGGNVKEFFPLHDPAWEPNRSAELEKLQEYQGWIARGMERAILKTINWSALYAVRQGISESPSEFLD
ncbi:hypothetical protein N320_11361, partial [Buceros rhinoceros silvestris]